MHSVRLTSGRTELILDRGCLTEIGPLGRIPYSAENTKRIKDLLMAHSAEIDLKAAEEAIAAVNGTVQTPVFEFTQPLPEHQKKMPYRAEKTTPEEDNDATLGKPEEVV